MQCVSKSDMNVLIVTYFFYDLPVKAKYCKPYTSFNTHFSKTQFE